MDKIALQLGRKFSIALPTPPLQEGIILVRGDNGCGKTTLLRVLASKFDIDLADFVKNESGFYLNNSAVFFEETTLSHGETLAKNLIYINAFLDTDTDRQKQYIKLLHLDKVMDRKFKKCSTGEKKKFLAVLNLGQIGKDIYYLDEPFENIDEKSKVNLLEILKNEFSSNNTLYLSTHSPEVVKSLDYIDFFIKN